MYPKGSVRDGLRGLGVTSGSGIGKIQWHFDGVVSSCTGGVVPSLPLEVAIVQDVAGTSVTPMIGIAGGRGDMGVVVNEHGGCTICGCGVGAGDFRPAERISMR